MARRTGALSAGNARDSSFVLGAYLQHALKRAADHAAQQVALRVSRAAVRTAPSADRCPTLRDPSGEVSRAPSLGDEDLDARLAALDAPHQRSLPIAR
jgi:hypothetical protein